MFRKKFNENKIYTGAVKDLEDKRDYPYEAVMSALPIGIDKIDWEKGYDVEQDLDIDLVIYNQGKSSSCVGQAWAKYGTIINFIETKEITYLSPKDIYSQIALPNSGAYIRDGGLLFVKKGVATEKSVSSYDNNKPPSESFMLNRSKITPEIEKEALIYQAKESRIIQGFDINTTAHAIINNHGVVAGMIGAYGKYNQGRPLIPTEKDSLWYHGILYSRFYMSGGRRKIGLPNTWGLEGGMQTPIPEHPDWKYKGYVELDEDYFGYNGRWIFSPWTIIDQSNLINLQKNMIKTIKFNDSPKIYGVDEVNKVLYWVGGIQSYERMLKSGWISPFEKVEKMEGYTIDESQNPFGFIF